MTDNIKEITWHYVMDIHQPNEVWYSTDSILKEKNIFKNVLWNVYKKNISEWVNND